jgi:hypothetical protein
VGVGVSDGVGETVCDGVGVGDGEGVGVGVSEGVGVGVCDGVGVGVRLTPLMTTEPLIPELETWLALGSEKIRLLIFSG